MSITEWLDDADDLDPVLRTALLESYRSEYGLEPEEQSVFNLLSLIDFEDPNLFRIYGESDERYRIRQGNDSVATALARKLSGQVRTGAMVALAPGTSGRGFNLTFQQIGGTRDQEFDHVVLALPFSTLRNTDLGKLSLPATKRRAIAELGYGTHTKLIGAFRGRPWQTLANKTGAVFTDNGLQYVWETSTGQRGNTGVLTNFLGGKAGIAAGSGDAESAVPPRPAPARPGLPAHLGPVRRRLRPALRLDRQPLLEGQLRLLQARPVVLPGPRRRPRRQPALLRRAHLRKVPGLHGRRRRNRRPSRPRSPRNPGLEVSRKPTPARRSDSLIPNGEIEGCAPRAIALECAPLISNPSDSEPGLPAHPASGGPHR